MKQHGRPTKYDPKYDEMLIDHMSKGLSAESFAGAIRISEDTFYNWIKKHKSFSEAKKIGRQTCLLKWEQIGITGTTGSKDVKNRIDGRHVQPAMWIYNMKCRFPEQWRDTAKEEEEKAERLLAYHRPKKKGLEIDGNGGSRPQEK